MNDKIKELAIKSMDSYPSFDNIARGQYSNSQYNSAIEQMMTTFAELIVQECARIAAEVGDSNVKLGYLVPRECSDKIKKHFGVEE